MDSTSRPGHLAQLRQQLPHWADLIRFDRPVGWHLLLWPTLWALWIAAEGTPSLHLLLVFITGTILMRSAGCIMNDLADRDFDGSVKRTANRPLVTGVVSVAEAWALMAVLCACAFVLVLTTNLATILLCFPALISAALYPYMKRWVYYPQLFLGIAFSMGIPMAFTATTGSIAPVAWLLVGANLLWTMAYDTCYAMVDRDDDLKIGIKSTAILFGSADKAMIGVLQALALLLLVLAGPQFGAGFLYYLGVAAAAGTFAWHQKLIQRRNRDDCFRAFVHNRVTGCLVWLGIALDYAFR